MIGPGAGAGAGAGARTAAAAAGAAAGAAGAAGCRIPTTYNQAGQSRREGRKVGREGTICLTSVRKSFFNSAN